MNRRDLLKMGGVLSLTTLLPEWSRAQSTGVLTSSPQIKLTTTIGNNHGHELVLTVADLVQALRATKTGDSVFFDIEGTAGHTHAVELNHEEALGLFQDGALSKKTSIGAGHNHPVSIRLEL